MCTKGGQWQVYIGNFSGFTARKWTTHRVNKIHVAELCCMHSYGQEIPAKDWEPALDALLPTGSQSGTQSTGELKFST